MYNIYQNTSNEQHSVESFKERMIEICNEHREQGRALAFAFILYDFTNPHISQVLANNAYWQALNEISGSFLTVFSLHHQEPPAPNYNPNIIHNMTMVPTWSNPRDDTNSLIRKYLGEDISVTFPAILFFQVDGRSVIDSILIELNEDYIEPSFNEIRSHITNAVNALQRIHEENRGNLREIYNCLEREVTEARFTRNFKRNLGIGLRIAEFIKAFTPVV
jgi:hypothetical protein